MEVRQNLVPESKWSIKCPYPMVPEFYVVHNTANDASAANEIAYMVRNNNQVSYHYAIDDIEIVQGVLENRNAWHAGDGGSGPGNRKGIGVEICYSKSGGPKFIAAEKRAAKFIGQGLIKRNWGMDRVKKHQDFMKKYCPHRTLDMGWQRFLDMVKAEMKGSEFELKTAIVVNSLVDVLAVEPLAKRLKAPIFLRGATDQMNAETVIVAGGDASPYRESGVRVITLSGNDRWETATNIGEYYRGL